MIIWNTKQRYALFVIYDFFEKLKEGIEAIGIFQLQVDPYVCYREQIVLLYYGDYCLRFSPYNDKNDEIYAYIQAYFNSEDDEEPKNIGIDLDHLLYGSK